VEKIDLEFESSTSRTRRIQLIVAPKRHDYKILCFIFLVKAMKSLRGRKIFWGLNKVWRLVRLPTNSRVTEGIFPSSKG